MPLGLSTKYFILYQVSGRTNFKLYVTTSISADLRNCFFVNVLYKPVSIIIASIMIHLLPLDSGVYIIPWTEIVHLPTIFVQFCFQIVCVFYRKKSLFHHFFSFMSLSLVISPFLSYCDFLLMICYCTFKI